VSRRLLGNEEMFKEAENKIKSILNLKLLTNKTNMRTTGGLANKNKPK